MPFNYKERTYYTSSHIASSTNQISTQEKFTSKNITDIIIAEIKRRQEPGAKKWNSDDRGGAPYLRGENKGE